MRHHVSLGEVVDTRLEHVLHVAQLLVVDETVHADLGDYLLQEGVVQLLDAFFHLLYLLLEVLAATRLAQVTAVLQYEVVDLLTILLTNLKPMQQRLLL